MVQAVAGAGLQGRPPQKNAWGFQILHEMRLNCPTNTRPHRSNFSSYTKNAVGLVNSEEMRWLDSLIIREAISIGSAGGVLRGGPGRFHAAITKVLWKIPDGGEEESRILRTDKKPSGPLRTMIIVEAIQKLVQKGLLPCRCGGPTGQVGLEYGQGARPPATTRGRSRQN